MDMNLIEKKLSKVGYKNPYFVSKDLGCPDDYCEFIKIYSGQELINDTFRLYTFPIGYDNIYGREIKELEGMYIFASDMGEYVYAFDSKNNWEVVDIDASGEVFERYGDFETFINQILDEAIESYEEYEED